MKILWVSRHRPIKSQLRELDRLFGSDCVLEVDPNPFSSAADIHDRFIQSGADEMILVAPLSVCKALIDLGIRPLTAQMREVPYDSKFAETKTDGARKGRAYQFVKFRRMVYIDVGYEEVRNGQQLIDNKCG